MKNKINELKTKFLSISQNESLARIIVSGFVINYKITPEELADIKTSVSEAVTNCIVHAYKNTVGYITMNLKMFDDMTLYISISDKGCGIDNIKKAMEPFYTTDKENERTGMGFAIMQSFNDKVKVNSRINKGTTVIMIKKLCQK